jgi:hypothetical protein
MDDKIDMELFERAVLKRSLALRADCHYLFNIVPTLELVRKAFSMGFDVVPLSEETRLMYTQPYTDDARMAPEAGLEPATP